MSITRVFQRADGRRHLTHDDRCIITEYPDGARIVERAGNRPGVQPGELVGYTAEGLTARLSAEERAALKAAQSGTAKTIQQKIDAGEPVTREELAALKEAGVVGDVTARRPDPNETRGR